MQAHDPLDTEGQAETEAKRRAAASLAADTERLDIEWLMGNERGRRIALGILTKAGIWHSSFDQNALLMAFKEGERAQGLQLLARITRHAPNQYQLMLQEGKE